MKDFPHISYNSHRWNQAEYSAVNTLERDDLCKGVTEILINIFGNLSNSIFTQSWVYHTYSWQSLALN